MLNVGGQVGRALRRVGRRLARPYPRGSGQKFSPYPRARIARFSEREPPFKCEDYPLGGGRQYVELARTVAEGCEMGGMPAPSFDTDRLLKAFPLDLRV